MPSPEYSTDLPPRNRRVPLSRSEIMSRIRSENTRPETKVRAELHASGIRFRKHVKDLPGKPDIANKANRWAIFVHGCFWHCHRECRLASKPKSNVAYSRPKLKGNVKRDRLKIRELRALGFRVSVVWECETRKPEKLRRTADLLVRRIRSYRSPKERRSPPRLVRSS